MKQSDIHIGSCYTNKRGGKSIRKVLAITPNYNEDDEVIFCRWEETKFGWQLVNWSDGTTATYPLSLKSFAAWAGREVEAPFSSILF